MCLNCKCSACPPGRPYARQGARAVDACGTAKICGQEGDAQRLCDWQIALICLSVFCALAAVVWRFVLPRLATRYTCLRTQRSRPRTAVQLAAFPGANPLWSVPAPLEGEVPWSYPPPPGMAPPLSLPLPPFLPSATGTGRTLSTGSSHTPSASSSDPLAAAVMELATAQDLVCIICTDVLTSPVSTVCGHAFCLSCLSNWMHEEKVRGKTPRCPCCRKYLPLGEPRLDPGLARRIAGIRSAALLSTTLGRQQEDPDPC